MSKTKLTGSKKDFSRPNKNQQKIRRRRAKQKNAEIEQKEERKLLMFLNTEQILELSYI